MVGASMATGKVEMLLTSSNLSQDPPHIVPGKRGLMLL